MKQKLKFIEVDSTHWYRVRDWAVHVKFALQDLWYAFTKIPGKTHTEVKTINEGENGYDDAEYDIAMTTENHPLRFDFDESPKV